MTKQQWSDNIILLELRFSILEENSLVMKIRQNSEFSLFYVIKHLCFGLEHIEYNFTTLALFA
jgi:hypothetical protein